MAKLNYLPLLLAVILLPAQATEQIEKNSSVDKTAEKLPHENVNVTYNSTRFQQYKLNRLLYAWDGNKYNRHLDAQISLRYFLTEPKSSKQNNFKYDFNAFIAYTGKFDFYVNSLESGPVHNTLFNPGMHFTYTKNKNYDWRESRLSFEHESNGQDVAKFDTYSIKAQAILNNNKGMTRSQSLDIAKRFISRSSNFIAVGGLYTFNAEQLSWQQCYYDAFSCIDLDVKFRLYSFDIEKVNPWELPNAALPNQKDYQGTRISLNKSWGILPDNKLPKASLKLTYRTGEVSADIFKYNTFDLEFFYNLALGKSAESFVLPLMFSIHHGYVEELYNFFEKETKYMVGLHFRY